MKNNISFEKDAYLRGSKVKQGDGSGKTRGKQGDVRLCEKYNI